MAEVTEAVILVSVGHCRIEARLVGLVGQHLGYRSSESRIWFCMEAISKGEGGRLLRNGGTREM